MNPEFIATLFAALAVFAIGVVAGVAVACYRLRGDRTMVQTVREVVPFLAGPRPRVPR
jgi:hypothetical protein